MSNVRRLGGPNNLQNIPHMLRNLAAEIESGSEPKPRTLLVISIVDPDIPPDLYQFGSDVSRLEEVGAMQACSLRALQVEQPS